MIWLFWLYPNPTYVGYIPASDSSGDNLLVIPMEMIPSGKCLHDCGKIHHFQCLNPLSMVIFNSKLLVITRGYQLQPPQEGSSKVSLSDRQERILIVRRGIRGSIEHVSGRKRLFWCGKQHRNGEVYRIPWWLGAVSILSGKTWEEELKIEIGLGFNMDRLLVYRLMPWR